MKQLFIFILIFYGITNNSYATATECASRAFSDALAATANTVNESDSEQIIHDWIYKTLATPDVLTTVLSCPEIIGISDTETIKFTPITYTFPNGREIIVNYETTPKILTTRLATATKRTLPNHDPNPYIDMIGGADIWTNTDPAWYAIMVVQHGALDAFVGPGKNNTISIDYIGENIDTLYPNGKQCTNKSAIANDNFAINRTVTETVNIDNDTNDYYVAGDANLQWISYGEIALDVVITVGTMGGGLVLSGLTKSARASRALKNLNTTIKSLAKTDNVAKYIRASRDATKISDEIRALDTATDAADAAKIADKRRELDALNDTIRTLESTDDVKQYRTATARFSELNKYRNGLRSLRAAQRGNIIARTARATKSVMYGDKIINRASKAARASNTSARIRDWLFNSTLRNAGAVAKIGASGGLVYGALQFIGGMYDWTETSTDEYTSGIDFSPLLLLSADDLNGQENTINHGMWLMWAGDSLSAADDDAAYLQAMDFAAKFHQDLTEIQNNTSTPCDIDIFIVRPILRNPDTDNAALYYLIMNDTPWTTHNE